MFSPVSKRRQSQSHSSHKTRLDALKEHNSFSTNSPKKSPEKFSSDEPLTPQNLGGRRKTIVRQGQGPVAGCMPLQIDVASSKSNEEMASCDDFDVISPSPIVNFHLNFKDKEKSKFPEKKSYMYSCESEVRRPCVADTGSPHERRYDQRKERNVRDKHVKYSAEYLRPIEEFVYPSLRPSEEELERQRLEAKKHFDFSQPDHDTPKQFNLQWKIQESDSLIIKPDLSSTMLYKIGEDGERTLRSLLTTKCNKKLHKESEMRLMEISPSKDTGLYKALRKGKVIGDLFSKAEREMTVKGSVPEHSHDPNDPNTLVSFLIHSPLLFECHHWS